MRFGVVIGVVAGLGLAGDGMAQVETIDPNLAASRAAPSAPARPPATPAAPTAIEPVAPPPSLPQPQPSPPPPPGDTAAAAHAAAAGTYRQQDVLAAAEGVFGRGAEGLAKLIEDIFRKQGYPNGYIVGREVGGAIGVGVRYGSGTLFHKVEGERPVFWQGPSVGFDLGANGAKTFVLVYNLYDTQDLFKRFPAAEGNLYVVGGFTASYLRWKDVVLIPIRLGVGWRLGANVGYMRFSEKRRWSPF